MAQAAERYLERSLRQLDLLLNHLNRTTDSGPQTLLQRADARAKVVAALLLIVAAASARNPWALLLLAAALLGMASALRAPIWPLFWRLALPVTLLALLMGAPAILLVPGQPCLVLPRLRVAVTCEGLKSFSLLATRGLATATVLAALLSSTPWMHVLKAMRSLGVPLLLVMILNMTYRYLYLLVQAALEIFQSWRSRSCGALPSALRRRFLTRIVGSLLTKTHYLGEEVYLAMTARGWRGDIFVLRADRMRAADWFLLAAALATAVFLWSAGR